MSVLSVKRRAPAPHARRAPCASSLAALAAAVALLSLGTLTGSHAAWCGGLASSRAALRPSVIARAAEGEAQNIKTQNLVVTKKAENKKSVAMAIVQRLLAKEGPVVAEGIGKEAVYNQVRSAIFAQDMLAEDHKEAIEGDKRVHMHFSRKKTTVRGNDNNRETTAELTSYSLGEAFGPEKIGESDWLKSSEKANAGKIAGAMKARLNEKGEAGITGIGFLAIYQAVRAVEIAEGYLAADGAPVELVVEPSFAIVAATNPDQSGEQITIVKLRVRKA
mmetsp:Transcript_41436/g.109293  ORF Transcript_41436/g.109293 Transcript_41436/m.109293 type:complete len:277 (-) Transcript_41436:323-1153(-)